MCVYIYIYTHIYNHNSTNSNNSNNTIPDAWNPGEVSEAGALMNPPGPGANEPPERLEAWTTKTKRAPAAQRRRTQARPCARRRANRQQHNIYNK